ncbi:hypothetical protein ACHAWF_018597 [Thalassiosira exigua]
MKFTLPLLLALNGPGPWRDGWGWPKPSSSSSSSKKGGYSIKTGSSSSSDGLGWGMQPSPSSSGSKKGRHSGKKGSRSSVEDGNASKLASKLRVYIEMGKNFDHGVDCPMADWNICYTQTLTLEYTGEDEYPNTQFKIFFSSIHRLLQVNHTGFIHEHVVGDLTYIKPTSFFPGFQPNTRVELPLVLEYWSVQETDNMPRWFVRDDRDKSTAVIENTNTEDLHSFVMPYTSSKKTPTDPNTQMTTANRFWLNEERINNVDASDGVIPRPSAKLVSDVAQTFEISGIYIENGQLLGRLSTGARDLLEKLGLSSNGSGSDNHHRVLFVIGPLSADISGPESYSMEINTEGTTIIGIEAPGLFYGLMSLVGLLDVASTGKMPLREMEIHDKPRFKHRGHHVDVARNFHSKEAIMKTIDAMALWKLNVLHLGLTNDEGWRLEIPGLEELTRVGSKRCFDLSEDTCLLTQLGSGPDAEEHQFYSRNDYIELLKYAQEKNVDIMPEIDMPGHARAAVISMEARARNGDQSYRLMDPEDDTFLVSLVFGSQLTSSFMFTKLMQMLYLQLTVQYYDRTSIINPCLESSVRFVEKLVGEVKQMHDDAGVPLNRWHCGGDEAKNILLGPGYSSYPDEQKQVPFSTSPACQAKVIADPSFDIDRIANYWAITVNKIIAANDIPTMTDWEDGLRGTIKNQYETQRVGVEFWETLFWGALDVLADIADDGFDIILASPDYLYFDFPYEINPFERGYYWASRENSIHKIFTYAPENLAQNAETSTDRDGNSMSLTTPSIPQPTIHGLQGEAWGETMRTDNQYYQMTFPRLLAVAERAWHRASWELEWSPGTVYDASSGLVPKDELATDYNGFASALGCKEVRKLEKLGITFRVPPPGAFVDSTGLLSANSELPCTTIMYSIDGIKWSAYAGPVQVGVGRNVALQSVSSEGFLKSRIVDVDDIQTEHS